MLNALTVDVEDWFHVQAFAHIFPSSEWDQQRARIIRNVIRTLEILREYDTKATFFILGWVAEKFPEIVGLIHDSDHELASHSQFHRLVYNLSAEEFKSDLMQSILQIERAADVTIKGYRAPSFSIRPDQSWVWDVMSECGIEYDSSIFPVRHDTYGTPSAPRFAYGIKLDNEKTILEIPPSTVRIFGTNVPVGGGGYLRMFPYWFIRKSIRRINSEGQPAVMYFHPWELDADQERVNAGLRSRMRHYTNLKAFEGKLRRLLADFRFSTISDVFIRAADGAAV
ncbi:MAG: DUF3473 domain-containing protein [candidate division Zixibacteria bacterium]|nr:DUF3473 domain-containing protein [candidate division Zixibacteria bacterium]MBU1471940.1 DUF3473 domain-containing protein [candidate division Zixibacteria bacterium]MBU2625249.1 DUF3473 domain-containing protein [candidate division Zixibacteria bacterium]